MNLSTKRLKRFNISRNLSVPRAFVEGIRVWGDDLFMAVSYRRARAFCRYTPDFKPVYRVEERDLLEKGFGEYRSFAVNDRGEMILCSSLPGNKTGFLTLEGSGEIKSFRTLDGIPLSESISTGDDKSIYIHSPFADHPVYRYSQDTGGVYPIGDFPETRKNITERFGQLNRGDNGDIMVIYENYPVCIQRYSSEGFLVFEKIFQEPEPSLDFITSVLDSGVDIQNGDIYLLKNSSISEKRRVEILDPGGNHKNSFYLPAETRRIGVAPEGVIYSSGTKMSIWAMLVSLQLYGAITTVDKYLVERRSL
jgi:hypothetical protein